MNQKNTFIFTGVLIKESEGYSGLCLDVDVASEGDTKEETKNNLIEAVNLYLETAIENNLPVIRSVTKEDNPLFKKKSSVVELFKIRVDLKVHTYA